jgi:hypothetical protein
VLLVLDPDRSCKKLPRKTHKKRGRDDVCNGLDDIGELYDTLSLRELDLIQFSQYQLLIVTGEAGFSSDTEKGRAKILSSFSIE